MRKLYQERLDLIEKMIGMEDEVEVVVPVGCGVIIKEGENFEKMILLIQRSTKDHWPLHWEFPRGKCDKPLGEDINHCVKREVKEETSLDVEPLSLIDTFEYIADKGKRKSIAHNILCKMVDPDQKIKLSKEHQDYKWVTSIGEVELLVNPDQKKTLIKVFNPELKITDVPESGFTKNNQIEEGWFDVFGLHPPNPKLRYDDLSKVKKKVKKRIVGEYLERIQQ